MSRFRIIDEKRYPLAKISFNAKDVDLLDYYRWEHRVTIGYRTRKFIIFLDNLNQKLYIEEITNGRLEQIDDDVLWESLYRWVEEKGFANVLSPLPKPKGYFKDKTTLMEKKVIL